MLAATEAIQGEIGPANERPSRADAGGMGALRLPAQPQSVLCSRANALAKLQGNPIRVCGEAANNQ